MRNVVREVDPVASGQLRELPRPSSTDVFDDGLATFVRDHYPRLIRLATLVCHRVDDGEDAVQAALERAWRSRTALQDDDRLRPWLDRIVVREAARTVRKRRTITEIAMVAPDPQADRRDEWAALRQAFSQLSTGHRAAVALHLYAGYTVTETAELLGVPQETVRSRLRVARERLRTLMREED